MRPECGLSTMSHCLEWCKLALHTRLPTPAVHYLVLNMLHIGPTLSTISKAHDNLQHADNFIAANQQA